MLPRKGRALVKHWGLEVGKVDWTTTFDFLVKINRQALGRTSILETAAKALSTFQKERFWRASPQEKNFKARDAPRVASRHI